MNNRLEDILTGVDYKANRNVEGIIISDIKIDSRKLEKGDMFVAVKGVKSDGHTFIQSAIETGVSCVVVDKAAHIVNDDVLVIEVENTREALCRLVDNMYEAPTQSFKLVGVTGTNGKTSVTTMCNYIYSKMQYRTGVIGTIDNYMMNKIMDVKTTTSTTPDCIELEALMDIYRSNNIDYVFMEVSSMALKMHRVDACRFETVIFNNLSPEHLDDHKTMDDYKNSKLKLFKMCNQAVVNLDDEIGQEVVDNCVGKVITFGIHKDAALRAKNVEYYSDYVKFDVCYNNENVKVKLNIPSEFAVYNALAVIGVCIFDGIKLEDAVSGFGENIVIAGRYERLDIENDFNVIVDYAHTAVAVENLLKAVRLNKNYNRIITVFGCGGDRDRTKRAPMGSVAQKLSDIVVVTSDNPRTEEPEDIIKDILEGIDSDKANVYIEPVREKAIELAVRLAQKDDVVVIAGKGHEKIQILKDRTVPFDDKEVAMEKCRKLLEE